jgi:hypothetical protein
VTLTSHRTLPLRAWALLLIAGFLYVQWVYAQHQAQFELHKTDHACEWCLVYGQAGHAVAGTLPSIPSATCHVFHHVPATTPHGLDALSFYGARAPPITLPV